MIFKNITIKIIMIEFTSIDTAISHFFNEIYPTLSTDEKEKIKRCKHNFLNKKSISNSKKIEILKNYSDAKIRIEIN